MTLAKELEDAEKRMQEMILKQTVLPNLTKGRLTMDDVFTMEERLKMAYAPVVMAESIWNYVDRVTEFCAVQRIDAVKKLSRAVKMVRSSYYDFMRSAIDREHITGAQQRADDFQAEFGHDMAIMWFTLNGELKKRYPDARYIDMRTDALCAITLVRVLKKFCRDTDKEIEKRCKVSANTFNPKLASLDDIMDGYVGDYEIDRTELVRRCEIIMYRAMETIKYEQ